MLFSQDGTLMKYLMTQIVQDSDGTGKKLSVALFTNGAVRVPVLIRKFLFRLMFRRFVALCK
jgi:hypothetical protein